MTAIASGDAPALPVPQMRRPGSALRWVGRGKSHTYIHTYILYVLCVSIHPKNETSATQKNSLAPRNRRHRACIYCSPRSLDSIATLLLIAITLKKKRRATRTTSRSHHHHRSNQEKGARALSLHMFAMTYIFSIKLRLDQRNELGQRVGEEHQPAHQLRLNAITVYHSGFWPAKGHDGEETTG